MIKNKRVLAVILARSGSKGIKKKNIYNICGHPLISYTIYAAKKSIFIDKLIVSTDSKTIAKICNLYGAETPFIRPKKLAKDKVWSRDALKHAVLSSESYYKTNYDVIIEIPATGPMRPFYEIDRAIKKLINTNATSVIGVSQIFDKHPVRIKKIVGDKLSDYNNLLKEGEGSRRQALPPCYARNGSIYVMTRDTIIKKFSRIGSLSRPLIMKSIHSINIDEQEDIYLFETLVKKGLCENRPADIFVNSSITIKNKNKKNAILITYNKQISENITKKILSNYRLIFCDQKNIHNVKSKDKIIGWLCSTQGEVKINFKTLNQFPNLNVLGSPSTGLTHIKLNDVFKKKIKLFYLTNKSYNKNILSSSEFAITLLLATLKKILLASKTVIYNNWRNFEDEMRSHEISFYKFGIYGYGRIGKNIFNFLKSYNKNIHYYDPNVSINKQYKVNNINTFLKKTNCLIICASLSKENIGFFNREKLSKLMKKSIILNISRGEIINENDLIKLIKSKYLSQYTTDVVSNENLILKQKNKLVEMAREGDNVFVTPHIAGLSYESEKKALTFVLKKIRMYLKIKKW